MAATATQVPQCGCGKFRASKSEKCRACRRADARKTCTNCRTTFYLYKESPRDYAELCEACVHRHKGKICICGSPYIPSRYSTSDKCKTCTTLDRRMSSCNVCGNAFMASYYEDLCDECAILSDRVRMMTPDTVLDLDKCREHSIVPGFLVRITLLPDVESRDCIHTDRPKIIICPLHMSVANDISHDHRYGQKFYNFYAPKTFRNEYSSVTIEVFESVKAKIAFQVARLADHAGHASYAGRASHAGPA